MCTLHRITFNYGWIHLPAPTSGKSDDTTNSSHFCVSCCCGSDRCGRCLHTCVQKEAQGEYSDYHTISVMNLHDRRVLCAVGESASIEFCVTKYQYSGNENICGLGWGGGSILANDTILGNCIACDGCPLPPVVPGPGPPPTNTEFTGVCLAPCVHVSTIRDG